jgi:HSP20 family molecular chaperone IbpA
VYYFANEKFKTALNDSINSTKSAFDISFIADVDNCVDENDKYIRRERYAGSMSRSFYVGENMKEEDIHAKYENGILTLDVPKEQKKAVPEKRYIAIEG